MKLTAPRIVAFAALVVTAPLTAHAQQEGRGGGLPRPTPTRGQLAQNDGKPAATTPDGKPKGDIAKVDLTTCRPVTGKLAFNFEKAGINEVLDQISFVELREELERAARAKVR